MSDDLIPTKAVAEHLGTTVATVNRWAAEGRITPALEMPGKTGARLFRLDEVKAQLAASAAQDAPAGDAA